MDLTANAGSMVNLTFALAYQVSKAHHQLVVVNVLLIMTALQIKPALTINAEIPVQVHVAITQCVQFDYTVLCVLVMRDIQGTLSQPATGYLHLQSK